MQIIIFRKNPHTYGYFKDLESLAKELRVINMEIIYHGLDKWQEKHVHIVKSGNGTYGHIVSTSKDSIFTEGEFKRVDGYDCFVS